MKFDFKRNGLLHYPKEYWKEAAFFVFVVIPILACFANKIVTFGFYSILSQTDWSIRLEFAQFLMIQNCMASFILKLYFIVLLIKMLWDFAASLVFLESNNDKFNISWLKKPLAYVVLFVLMIFMIHYAPDFNQFVSISDYLDLEPM